MIIKRKFGTVYLDGKPVPPGTRYPDSAPKIEIRDTVPGMEISWILSNRTLIADRNILTNISWDTLAYNQLVFERQISLSEETWIIRLIKGSSKRKDWMEMAELLRTTCGDLQILHICEKENPLTFHIALSWGQDLWEDDIAVSDHATCWGALAPMDGQAQLTPYRCPSKTASVSAEIGWRPVLEFSHIYQSYDSLMGKDILVRTNDGNMAAGTLAELTEYDMILENANLTTDLSQGICRDPHGAVIIMRNCVECAYPWNCQEQETI